MHDKYLPTHKNRSLASGNCF